MREKWPIFARLTADPQHDIVCDIEIIPIQQIDAAYERMLKSDVKYRSVIDMASLTPRSTGA